jgi:hypothetical protein
MLVLCTRAAIDTVSGSLHAEHGNVFMFGEGKWGKIGNGCEANVTTPVMIDAARFGGETIRSLALGCTHSAAITGMHACMCVCNGVAHSVLLGTDVAMFS